MLRQLTISVVTLSLLPLAAHAQSGVVPVSQKLFEVAGMSVTFTDFLTFVIAIVGIAGLLLIRRQSNFL